MEAEQVRDDEADAAETERAGAEGGWPLGGWLWALVAEGVVADLLWTCDADTRWWGGNRHGADVYACSSRHPGEEPNRATARLKVDVKRLFRMHADRGQGKGEHLGFMGGGRPEGEEARPDLVTHYGLVLFDEDGTQEARLHVALPLASVTAAHAVERVYLVPRQEVNALFRRGHNKAGAGTGLNLYALEQVLAPYELYPVRLVDPCGACAAEVSPTG